MFDVKNFLLGMRNDNKYFFEELKFLGSLTIFIVVVSTVDG